ncbi:hypothetical protein Acr_27g0008940 [Actinidia rufa]|uniref:Uncharacterized protein n=1 Tax=Actinidia rufa TaxID=165716 RepID=A0A7J0H881_9ERIC|nr:hypothetical protein Acr_27g0008940 [Actinidia rufa]
MGEDICLFNKVGLNFSGHTGSLNPGNLSHLWLQYASFFVVVVKALKLRAFALRQSDQYVLSGVVLWGPKRMREGFAFSRDF